MMFCDFYTFVLALLGLIVLLNFLYNNLWGFLQLTHSILAPYFIVNEENTTLAKKYGSWALITGSTDGIGKAYATELAKRGINVILVSRSKEKLENTAKEIESQYSVKTKIIAADFSLGEKAIDIIKKEIGSTEIGILVNNVGKQYEYPMYLEEVPEQDLWDIININIGAVTMMCRTFVKDMKKRGKGAIVNVSSASELQPLPLMTVYAATKAYIKSFTASLRYEYGEHGLTIQHLGPFFVNTKMNKFSDRFQKNSFMVPDPDMYARYAVSILGRQDKSTGYWTHGIQSFLTEIAPEWIRMHIGGQMNKHLRNEYLSEQKKKIS